MKFSLLVLSAFVQVSGMINMDSFGDATNQLDPEQLQQMQEMLNNLNGDGEGEKKKTINQICEKGQHLGPKPLHERKNGFKANGCGHPGHDGAQLEEEYGLHKCCNRHDICLQGCGMSFSTCQTAFRQCMKDVCNDQENGDIASDCHKVSNVFYDLQQEYGRPIFYEYQREACDCHEYEEEAHDGYVDYFKGVYQIAGQKKNTQDKDVNALLYKFRGKKREKLMEAVNIKYGSHFVEFLDVAPDLHHEEL